MEAAQARRYDISRRVRLVITFSRAYHTSAGTGSLATGRRIAGRLGGTMYEVVDLTVHLTKNHNPARITGYLPLTHISQSR